MFVSYQREETYLSGLYRGWMIPNTHTKMDENKVNCLSGLGGSAELQDSNMKEDEAMFSCARKLQIMTTKTVLQKSFKI